MHSDLVVTITGISHYYGARPFEPDCLLLLVKEPGNPHDAEAICVQRVPIGTVGYVANSPHTVIAGTMSAGRVYDKMGNACFARVRFAKDGFVVAELEPAIRAQTVVVRIEDAAICEPIESMGRVQSCQNPPDRS